MNATVQTSEVSQLLGWLTPEVEDHLSDPSNQVQSIRHLLIKAKRELSDVEEMNEMQNYFGTKRELCDAISKLVAFYIHAERKGLYCMAS